MYSPKIREDLIMRLYPIGKKKAIPMTQLVNDIVEGWLRGMQTSSLFDRIVETYDLPQITK